MFGYGHFVFESAAQEQGLRDIRFVGYPDKRDLTIQRVVQRSGTCAPLDLLSGHDKSRCVSGGEPIRRSRAANNRQGALPGGDRTRLSLLCATGPKGDVASDRVDRGRFVRRPDSGA